MSYYLRIAASNLGNILSTESISPAALYPMRKSGYKTFESLDAEPMNANGKALHLHKEQPSFTGNDYGCSVMLIKIPDDTVSSPQEKSGTTWTTETIYLEPRKGFSFIFESQEELNSAFNAVTKNSEAKFASEYRRIATTASQAKYQLTIETNDGQNGSPNENSLMKANRFETLDRLKGAIYCYQLDKTLSVPGDQINRKLSIECMKATDELVNTVTQKDDSKINESEKRLTNALYALALRNEARKYERALEEGGGETLPDCDYSWQSINKDFSIDIPSGIINSQFELEIFRTGIEQRIREISHREFKPTSKGKISAKDSSGTPAIVLPSSSFGPLAEHLVNWLATNDVYHEEGNSIGYSFARKCGAEIKRFLGKDKWEEKSTDEEGARSCQDYINGLLERLNKSEPFDFKNSLGIDPKTFEALHALALLCAKDSNEDLESFYRYLLLKHEVTDFRLPFAVWGAVFGFSQIPKMLCDQMDPISIKDARKLFRSMVEIERTTRNATRTDQKSNSPDKDTTVIETITPPISEISEQGEEDDGKKAYAIEIAEQKPVDENKNEEDSEASA